MTAEGGSMKTIYLLGAGFSKAISSQMPTLSELGKSLDMDKYPMIPGVAVGEIETVLTYLGVPQPWLPESDILRNRARYQDLVREIAGLLQDCVDKALLEKLPRNWLHSLVRRWHQDQASIVTLNYDTLLERAACSYNDLVLGGENLRLANLYPIPLTPAAMRRVPVLGPTEKPSFKLIKLHGSINWFYSPRATPGEPIYLGEGNEWPDNVRRPNWKNDVRDKVPAIIPPTLDKGSYLQHDTLRSLWAQAAEALGSADTLVAIGYSLPVTDLTMRFLLEGAGGDGKKLVVVNKDPAAADHFRRLLGHRFDVQSDPQGEDAVPKFVSSLTGWRPEDDSNSP